jgi:endoglucanase
MRIPFRIAVDYVWNKEDRAKEYLENNFGKLDEDFNNRRKLATGYYHDGGILEDRESPVMYATSLPYFMIKDPKRAAEIYNDKILRLYSTDSDGFVPTLSYYDENWLWFGAALYNGYFKKL